MPFNDTFLEELRSKNEISEVIGAYVNLKRAGRLYKGLCPFHGEKTPSFTVYPDTQSFYCFGCGVGGDVVSFIRKAENLDYTEAVKLLADRSGMAMPDSGYDDSMLKRRTSSFHNLLTRKMRMHCNIILTEVIPLIPLSISAWATHPTVGMPSKSI